MDENVSNRNKKNETSDYLEFSFQAGECERRLILAPLD